MGASPFPPSWFLLLFVASFFDIPARKALVKVEIVLWLIYSGKD